MDAEDFKKVKLKKTKTKVGRRGTEQLVSDPEQQTKLMEKVSFNNYYPLIKDYTFQTLNFALKEKEVDELISEAAKLKKDRKSLSWLKNETLVGLAKKVEEYIYEKMKVKSGFIRFNTMSPKDGIFGENQRMRQLFIEAMSSIPQEEDFVTATNKKIYALYIASTTGMKIIKGMDAIRLLVHSKRTTHELTKYKEGKLPKPHMIVREFADFDVQYEFRAFVYKKKLVGISQYNPYCFFPRVKKDRSKLEEIMKKFIHERMLDSKELMTEYESFIIDVIIMRDMTCRVVELNPYGEFAGSCLFDWSVGDDFKLLTGKKEKFEFRIVEKPPPFVARRIEPQWLDVMKIDEKKKK